MADLAEQAAMAFKLAKGLVDAPKVEAPKPKLQQWQLTKYEDIDVVGNKYEVAYEPNPEYIDQFFHEVQPGDLFTSGRTDSSRPPYSQRRTSRKSASRAFDYFYSRYDGARANQWSVYAFAAYWVAFNDYLRRVHFKQDKRVSWRIMRVQCRDCFEGQRSVKALMKDFGFKPGITREEFLQLMAVSDADAKGPKKGALARLAGLDEDGNPLADDDRPMPYVRTPTATGGGGGGGAGAGAGGGGGGGAGAGAGGGGGGGAGAGE